MAGASNRALFEAAAGHLAAARRVLFVTGAGLSAASGLPTYRGVGGLYESHDTEEGLPVEVALSGQVFAVRPDISWKHIARLERSVRGARPNRAHAIIAEMERRFEVVVFTQNVDGFHREAGSSDVIDIHGDVHDLRCTRCDDRRTVPDYADLVIPPRCECCGAIVRPDVVLFGELLDVDKVRRLEAEVARGFDVVFSVGTTSVFPYVAAPVVRAARRGKATVEINPGRTEVSGIVELRLVMGAVEALEGIWRAVTEAPRCQGPESPG